MSGYEQPVEGEPSEHVDVIPVTVEGISDEETMSEEALLAAEAVLADPEIVDRHAETGLIVGRVGTLSEMMGPEDAEAYVDAHSLTRITRVRAARRLGRVLLDA